MPGSACSGGGFSRAAWLAAGLLLLAGCTTQEYRNAESVCRAEWMLQLPPEYRTRPVNRIRYEEVPDGKEVCTTETVRDDSDPETLVLKTKEVCKQGTRTKQVPYISIETIDVNKAERDAQILDCTAQACLLSHGNASCKPPE